MAKPMEQPDLPGVPAAPTDPDNVTDRAIRAVKDFQAGKATTSFVRDALAKLNDSSRLYVSIATRLPEKTLKTMAGLS